MCLEFDSIGSVSVTYNSVPIVLLDNDRGASVQLSWKQLIRHLVGAGLTNLSFEQKF